MRGLLRLAECTSPPRRSQSQPTVAAHSRGHAGNTLRGTSVPRGHVGHAACRHGRRPRAGAPHRCRGPGRAGGHGPTASIGRQRRRRRGHTARRRGAWLRRQQQHARLWPHLNHQLRGRQQRPVGVNVLHATVQRAAVAGELVRQHVIMCTQERLWLGRSGAGSAAALQRPHAHKHVWEPAQPAAIDDQLARRTCGGSLDVSTTRRQRLPGPLAPGSATCTGAGYGLSATYTAAPVDSSRSEKASTLLGGAPASAPCQSTSAPARVGAERTIAAQRSWGAWRPPSRFDEQAAASELAAQLGARS